MCSDIKDERKSIHLFNYNLETALLKKLPKIIKKIFTAFSISEKYTSPDNVNKNYITIKSIIVTVRQCI